MTQHATSYARPIGGAVSAAEIHQKRRRRGGEEEAEHACALYTDRIRRNQTQASQLAICYLSPWEQVSKKCVFRQCVYRIRLDDRPKRCKTCAFTPKKRFRVDGPQDACLPNPCFVESLSCRGSQNKCFSAFSKPSKVSSKKTKLSNRFTASYGRLLQHVGGSTSTQTSIKSSQFDFHTQTVWNRDNKDIQVANSTKLSRSKLPMLLQFCGLHWFCH